MAFERGEKDKMKGIKFVKVIFDISPVESFIVEHQKVFVFEGEHFSTCETIEEIRDQIMDETSIERIKYTYIFTFKNKKDLVSDDFDEYEGH